MLYIGSTAGCVIELRLTYVVCHHIYCHLCEICQSFGKLYYFRIGLMHIFEEQGFPLGTGETKLESQSQIVFIGWVFLVNFSLDSYGTVGTACQKQQSHRPLCGHNNYEISNGCPIA